MNTIEETRHAQSNGQSKSFDVFLAEIFKKPPGKKPDIKKENRDDDNDHHFDAKTLALLVVMVIVLSVLTSLIAARVYYDRVLVEHSHTSKLHPAR